LQANINSVAACDGDRDSIQMRVRSSDAAASHCVTSAVTKGMVRPEAAWNVSADATCKASRVLSPAFAVDLKRVWPESVGSGDALFSGFNCTGTHKATDAVVSFVYVERLIEACDTRDWRERHD